MRVDWIADTARKYIEPINSVLQQQQRTHKYTYKRKNKHRKHFLYFSHVSLSLALSDLMVCYTRLAFVCMYFNTLYSFLFFLLVFYSVVFAYMCMLWTPVRQNYRESNIAETLVRICSQRIRESNWKLSVEIVSCRCALNSPYKCALILDDKTKPKSLIIFRSDQFNWLIFFLSFKAFMSG